ncbi:MAG: hypothetical protein PHC62_00760 [Candidatus Izemoplasmatales bacterium]|nr:hypothetical protein [Candidatus Izemoplasmatales bacterium]
MFFLDELMKNKITKKKFLLPLDDKNKRKGSLVHLLTPNFNSSLNMIHNQKIMPKYFFSYYMEKFPMYYINSKMNVNSKEEVPEMVEEVVVPVRAESNNGYFTFHGLDRDVEALMDILRPDMIKYFQKIYRIKIKKVDVYITHGDLTQSCTSDKIIMASKTTFDKRSYLDYEKYILMYMHLLSAQIANPKINENLMMASALVMSGIYREDKPEYGFGFSLTSLCNLINQYIKIKGQQDFIDKVLIKNNTIKMTIEIFKDIFENKNELSVMLNKKNRSILSIKESMVLDESSDCSYELNCLKEGYLPINENLTAVFHEANSSYDQILRRNLFKDRIKTNKDLLAIYKDHMTKMPNIKYAYLRLDKYKGKNLYNDLYYYNEVFFRNNGFSHLRKYQVYLDLMERMIVDKRFNQEYSKKTVLVPVADWMEFTKPNNGALWLIANGVNPISCFYRSLLLSPNYLKDTYKDINFVFMGQKSYFVVDFSQENDINKIKTLFLKHIKLLCRNYEPTDSEDETDEEGRESSPKAIATDIIEKIEKTQRLNITNITPSNAVIKQPQVAANVTKAAITAVVAKNATTKPKEELKSSKPEKKEIKPKVSEKKPPKVKDEINKDELKQELIDRVTVASSTAKDTEDAIDILDDDERVKEILATLAMDADDGPKMSAARTSRLLKLEDDFLDKEFKNKSIRDILQFDETEEAIEIEPISLDIDSVNQEWQELRYANVNQKYNLDKDILAMFNFFHDKKYPLVVKDIKVEDTSTSDDAVETYSVVYENEQGKRFTVVIDIPKFIDGKYMKLRGNTKNISSQLFPMPIMKTEEDTVQIASCYNKIFVRRFGTTTGKTNVGADRLVKTLNKNKFNNLRILEGDNSRVCSKYEVPVDYIDIGSIYSELETDSVLFQFNQDKLRKEYGDIIDLKQGFPIGYHKIRKEIIYYRPEKDAFQFLSSMITNFLSYDIPDFAKAYNKTSVSVKYTFSQASILGVRIPLVVICAYSEGLEKVMKKANIRYEISEKRPQYNKDGQDIIRWKDGYLLYDLNYASSLLMNGLKVCNTEDFSIAEMNRKTTYINFLDSFGGRIKADGLDNFYELFIDKPITFNSLKYYKLPTDYIELLVYANQLLTDNHFINHTSIDASRRIRRQELIADLLYREVLSKAYGDYVNQIKHRGQGSFSVKRNGLINAVLLNNTTEDLSIINPVNEYESYNRVSPEGPGGLNASRAYTLEKRGYDESMQNVLSMSTGFSEKVGIPRQATIDANINGYRGYITNNSEDDKDEINVTKTLAMTEALTPYGITRDDPFRSAMNFVQTSKHGMRCRQADPLLITTGADEALPYLISNTFAYKSQGNGQVIEKDDNHLLIRYDNKNGEPTYDYIDLTEQVEKNSSSGFFVILKLDSDLKVGNKIKEGQVIAYDKTSFSNSVGMNDNIAYNVGTLNKFAILNTDEGYEDSAIISQDLSAKMTTDIVIKKTVNLPKDTNIFNMVKKGQSIREGDPLLIIQRPYDEDDMNTLLKNLVADEDEITELGRQHISSSVTGIVQDIIISRTVEKSELSSSLKKAVTTYEKSINEKKKIMEQYNIDKKNDLPSTDVLPSTGKLKNSEDGVLIEFFLKYEDKMAVGDKLIYWSALKGVVKDIFPEGKEPRSEFRPDEKIHSLLSIGSVNGRMTCSIIITSVINKGLIELSRKVKDILGIKYDINL